MTANDPRETLMCIGGPLNTVRVSVPSGLKWFTLENGQIMTCDALDPEKRVVEIETIAQVSDFSTAVEWEQSGTGDRIPAYVRTTFVTGEKGLVHVLSFREM